MGGWNFDLTIVSASNLPNVRHLGRMKVYAQVSITEKPNFLWKTPVDHDGETNPKWNVKTPLVVSDRAVQGVDVVLIKLFCERSCKTNKYVGEVRLPLKSLFDNRLGHDRPEFEEYNVVRADENEKGCFGRLKISHRFHKIPAGDHRTSVPNSPRLCSQGSSDHRWEQLLAGVSKAVKIVVEDAADTAVTVVESFIEASSAIVEAIWPGE